MVTGCSDRGDLGRHSPSLISKTYTSTLAKAYEVLGEPEDYDLPLTAAEDALRLRAQDMASMGTSGVISQIVRPLHGDGFSRVEAITEDLKVERQRFGRFVEAARQVMRIDQARARVLEGLDAIAARRQKSVAVERRGRNDQIIRQSVRTMRERSLDYQELLKALPVEYPDVPLRELQNAYEAFHEDVVRFHAEIDKYAYMKLGRGRQKSYK